jgi:hypothetical protein
MGITGFNLARRKQEEAANAASLSCPAPVPATPAVAEEKPKRKRRATPAPAPVEHPTWSEVKPDFVAAVEADAKDGDEE